MRSLPILALVLPSCGFLDQETREPAEALDATEPGCITVSPRPLAFDPLDVAQDDPATETLQILNECAGELQLGLIEMEDPTAPFELGVLTSTMLAGGSSASLAITFAPQQGGTFSTPLQIHSNDPETPIATVSLQGEAIAPRISLQPETLDLGEPLIGCGAEEAYTLSNEGSAWLVVSAVDLVVTTDEFVLDLDEETNGTLPWLLEPGEERTIWLSYEAHDSNKDSAGIQVTSNDPATPTLTVQASGAGVADETATDEFYQATRPQVDVLFTVDRNFNNKVAAAQLAEDVDALFDHLDQLAVDWHVAAVVASDGCIVGDSTFLDGSLTRSKSESIFESMVDLDYTESSLSAYTYRGFELATQARKTANSGTGGCNEGVFRKDATLSVVHFSNYDDMSTSTSVADYVATLSKRVSAEEKLVISAIAGDVPSGCGTAQPGTRYNDAVESTGGVFASICESDYRAVLEEVAELAVEAGSRYPLSRQAVTGTVSVRVEGIVQSTGWAYDAETNTVSFDTDYLPPVGAEVAITYAVEPESCD